MSKEKKNNKKIISKVQQATEKAIREHNMIEPKDKILVGVSGGIDSLVLLENLSKKRLFYNFKFEIKAVHINIENIPYTVEKEFLTNFCTKLNVEIIFVEKKIEIDNSKLTTNPCFICSWNRRKLLFDYAKEHNYNKLAFGHHKDDAVETFMMNLIFHGSISSLPASLSMFDGRMKLIRPMIYLKKEDITNFAKVRDYKTQIKTCHFDNKTSRRKMNSVVSEMEKFNPHVRENIFKAMSNIYEEYLPSFSKKLDLTI